MGNTLFYKAFIFSTIINGDTVENIEGCNSTINIQDDKIKIELYMLNGDKRVIYNKITDESEFPTLWIDKGFLTFNLRSNGEAEYSKLINEKRNQYNNIVFTHNECMIVE